MKVIKTNIEGVVVLEPYVFEDARGYFYESFSQLEFSERVCDTVFVQDNQAWSHGRGILRGLHYQLPPHAQAKLVRVVHGRVMDVAVDIRKGSPTFGLYVAVELSAENNRQLFIPRGFAHGYVVLSNGALFQYKCDGYYAPQSEAGIRFDDPALAVDWGLPESGITVSARDEALPALADAQLFDYNAEMY